MSVIELRSVYKIFGPRSAAVLERVRAGETKEAILAETGHTVGLRDVSLSIPGGQIFVVMGLSGSGKSTLIRHLNRLIDPTAGEVLIGGTDVLGLDEAALTGFRRQKMSMVFQRFGLFPHRTVLDNVTFGLEVRGSSRAERAQHRETARHWIEQVGLGGYEDAYPHALSGGMQQRVGLARALATDAEILLMDEAFSALDPLIRREMQDQLLELQGRLKKTIVFITHDLDEALRLGDRIAILNEGEIVQTGTGEEILTRPADDYVAEFVEDVNRGRVLTAGRAMAATDGVPAGTPAAELAAIARGQGAEPLYIVDGEGRPAGAVRAARLRRASKGKDKTAGDLMEPVVEIGRGKVLEQALPLTLESELPLAVCDEEGRLVGALSREAIIRALAEHVGVGGPASGGRRSEGRPD